jgi:hypothetical protein
MASTAGIDWQVSPADMAGRVERYKKALIAAVFRLAGEWATRIADDARSAAPWTDRTGAARAGLFGRAFRTAMGAVLICGHGVPYGIYLERRWGGKYAAIMPALQRNYAAVMASLQQLVA